MSHTTDLFEWVRVCFRAVPSSWPIGNLIAVNPLQGFEDRPIEEAFQAAAAYFEQTALPPGLCRVNSHTIKWLAVYCDEGQAMLTMPLREHGLYAAWRTLVVYDEKIHHHKKENITFLSELPEDSAAAIGVCLSKLNIDPKDHEEFLRLILTTLPGWASYIKYTAQEAPTIEEGELMQMDYLAVRLVITTLVWPEAGRVLHQYGPAGQTLRSRSLAFIEATEEAYRTQLLRKISGAAVSKKTKPDAQWVFCIDIRSEPFRRCLETVGNHETFGCAGFFGLPVGVRDEVTGASYASCPALLKPRHFVTQDLTDAQDKRMYQAVRWLKEVYDSLKYNFATPFLLAEGLGIFSGVWMGVRTAFPYFAAKIKATITRARRPTTLNIDDMPVEDQCRYAETLLRTIGLTDHFAPWVVLCGHRSHTENNPYATALDCGACGGRPGGVNARLFAMMMNHAWVRQGLARRGICVPEQTVFIAAEHNTTTDEVVVFSAAETQEIQKLKKDCLEAGALNRIRRFGTFGSRYLDVARYTSDWAQVRPEWGLAGNAALIVGPRDLTRSLDLEGRCFLHSYDYAKDPQGIFLTGIVTGAVPVAQGINMHYLLSTLDNVAYGGGSKVTSNRVGRWGMMQGNASDLMQGLPLQSVYRDPRSPQHEAQRLIVLVLAPRAMLDQVIEAQGALKKLLENGWMQMLAIEPEDGSFYLLHREGSWKEIRV